jgi:beta-lactamase class A
MEACARDVHGLALSKASREFAWRALIDQRFRDQIPAGLHPQSGARVGHKTGLTSSVEHDAAVVELPDGRRYVFVTLASGLDGDAAHEKAREAARRASRAAWDCAIAP